jgi:hypothetical protein
MKNNKNLNDELDMLLSKTSLPSDYEIKKDTVYQKRVELANKNASKAGKQSRIKKKGIFGLSKEEVIKNASIAGKIRGKIIGRANVESGHWAKCHELAKEACYIPILQCDKKTGKIIKEWKGTQIAADSLNINNKAINNNLKGLSKSCGGYVWKYKK